MDSARKFALLLLLHFGSASQRLFVEDSVQAVPYAIGGARVNFQLPTAFDDTAAVQCATNFQGDEDTHSYVPTIPFDRQHVICRLPEELSSGKVDVTLEVDGTTVSELHSGSFLIYPEPTPEFVVTENWDDGSLSLSWDQQYFSQYLPPDANIYLEVTFYMSENGGTKFVARGTVQVVGANTGTARVSVSSGNLQEIERFRFPYYYVLRQLGTNSDVFLTSEFFTPTLNKTELEAQGSCMEWLAVEPGPPEDLDPCPKCLCQAKIDTNFIQAQYHSQILKMAGSELNNHVYYYQRTPTAKGHAQTCSYNVETNALAIKSPAQAAWSHYVSKDVSYVGNYMRDIWPYIICCLESNEQGLCDSFHEKRPKNHDDGYPGADEPCYGTEDPHMNTFDGVRYDFMGFGEFWLIHAPNGDGVQARMSTLASNPNQKVTYYKAIAIKDGNTTVEILHDASGKLLVLLNGKDYLALPQGPVTIPLPGISLRVLDATKIEVHMEMGFTIRAEGTPRAYFNIYGSGAQKNKGKGFMGIFGNFDGNATNDLTSRSGMVIENTPENLRDLQLIHNQFGLTWMISKEESFFSYANGTGWEDFNDPDFGPVFVYPDPSEFSDEVRAICKESLACYYEYAATGELGDAEAVAGDEDNTDKLKEEVDKVILQCDKLESPGNGTVRVEGYLNGSIATYLCNQDYELTGISSRVCAEAEDKAEWAGDEPTCLWTCGICTEDIEYQLTHDPSDCNKYFFCAQGQRVSLQCPPGESFNPEYLLCDKEYPCTGAPGCRR